MSTLQQAQSSYHEPMIDTPYEWFEKKSSGMQGQQVMDQQVADSLAQQAYVNQAVFPLHMFPHTVQQDITNALNSGNNELAQAEIQRFMQYAQVRRREKSIHVVHAHKKCRTVAISRRLAMHTLSSLNSADVVPGLRDRRHCVVAQHAHAAAHEPT